MTNHGGDKAIVRPQMARQDDNRSPRMRINQPVVCGHGNCLGACSNARPSDDRISAGRCVVARRINHLYVGQLSGGREQVVARTQLDGRRARGGNMFSAARVLINTGAHLFARTAGEQRVLGGTESKE